MNISQVPGILGKIGRDTQARIERSKTQMPQTFLESDRLTDFSPKDFTKNLRQNGIRVIAEIKFASPSKGEISSMASPVQVANEYLAAGASALSILTEPNYFKGDISYLRQVREVHSEAFILMKDFLIDPYQLHQALWAGADAVLIIVALLGKTGSQTMLEKALSLGLTPLVEVHNEEELNIAIEIGASLIGVNNRNLKDLSISLETSERLLKNIDKKKYTLVGESGIKTRSDLDRLIQAGCHGFLIGSSLMATGNPGKALNDLLGSES